MKVFVTGHRGYLGAHLCPLLRDLGHTVDGRDAGLFETCAYPDMPPLAKVEPNERGDIRDLRPDHFDGYDAVIHLAGLSNDPLGDLDPVLTDAINRAAAVHVAQTARDAGVRRFLFASTCSVYGARDADLLDETAQPQPVTPYARAKAAAEVEIARLASPSFTPVFLRPGTVFGLGPRPRFDLVLNNLLAWAAATDEVRLKSDGSAWRPLVHVTDVARAFAALLEPQATDVSCRAFNVTTQAGTLTVRQLADRIVRSLDGVQLTQSPGASRDPRSYRVSGARLADLIGPDWAQWDIDQGIAEIANALDQHPVSVNDFEGPRFQRLAHLKSRMAGADLGTDLRPVKLEMGQP
ncbi:MAG: NAD(P)-dependent oxidoreductase [Pseudomonadota bacterium]